MRWGSETEHCPETHDWPCPAEQQATREALPKTKLQNGSRLLEVVHTCGPVCILSVPLSLSHMHTYPFPPPNPWPRVSLVIYTHLFFEAASHVAPSVLIVFTYTCALWTSGPLAAIFKWWWSGMHHQSQCPAVLGTKPRAPCTLRIHSTEHHCQPLCAVLTTIEYMMAYWVLCLLIWEAILKQWTVSGIYFRWPHSAPYI